ncbi:iron-sulfur cluster co-chaperone protein HscB isoform X1 [Rhinatrema bivittatum]|uniref:iron-sulfur cluster co-chaperone protein HscB isoform X1 n=2 Tax=Rhinatrema bivittatum TaxID=194408 RepID=UPI00112D9226|nr:iron-sulfur cluster co-chaperone protein HscB isoform X1 [Rhinatrema bivittatum]
MIRGRLKSINLTVAWSCRPGIRPRRSAGGVSTGPLRRLGARIVAVAASEIGGGEREASTWRFALPWSDGARKWLNCWSCQRTLPPARVFCPSCSALQPPDAARDYFEILDCDRSFNIDVQKLQQKFRDLQRSLHPDYFTQKSQKEQELSAKQSSLVNKAYRTLLTPLSRGLYMLKLNGIELEERTDSGMEREFLTEIMEFNEKLAEANTEAELQDIGNIVRVKHEELTDDVNKAFMKGDLQKAKVLLAKMQYFSNLVDKVKEKMIPS